MELKIFTIIYDKARKTFDTEEFDKFCMSKRIYSYKVQYIYDGEDYIWSVVVEYDNIVNKVEKTIVKLSESEQKLFDKLRLWRKNEGEVAGVPAYIVANNKELEAVVINRPKTFAELSKIEGFEKKKEHIKRYIKHKII